MRGKESVKKRKGGFNIQSIIMSVLMASTLITITIMGLLLYHRFKLAMDNTAVSNTEATVESSVDRLNSDLLDIRQIFNAANYNIIQEFDISNVRNLQSSSVCCMRRIQIRYRVWHCMEVTEILLLQSRYL